MSVPINTIEGLTKIVIALKKICEENKQHKDSLLYLRAESRLHYWERELFDLEREIADKYIDKILDELE